MTHALDYSQEMMKMLGAIRREKPTGFSSGGAHAQSMSGGRNLSASFKHTTDPDRSSLLHIIAVSRYGESVLLARYFEGTERDVQRQAIEWEQVERL